MFQAWLVWHDCQQAPIRWSCGHSCDLSPVLQNTWQWLQRARAPSWRRRWDARSGAGGCCARQTCVHPPHPGESVVFICAQHTPLLRARTQQTALMYGSTAHRHRAAAHSIPRFCSLNQPPMPAKDANSRTSAPPRPTATLYASSLRRPVTVLTDGRRLPPTDHSFSSPPWHPLYHRS